jgi:hypothetical protein
MGEWNCVRAFVAMATLVLPLMLWHHLTPCNRVLLEKFTVAQLVNKFCSCYVTWRFISRLTRACHWSLFWSPCIQYTSFTLQFFTIFRPTLFYHLHLSLPHGQFALGFLTTFCTHFSSLSCLLSTHLSHLLWIDHPNNIWREHSMKFFIM